MKNNKIKNKKGFTLIEILLIVAIIGILATIILVSGISRGRDRAAINSYKTTMNSVKTAMEICGGNITQGGGLGSGTNICGPGVYESIKYPDMKDAKCGNDFTFSAAVDGDGDWIVSTDQDCKGCRLICDIYGCVAWTGTDCD
jgi:type IV pilus assembly protein PilA